jgi:hypothetical protein
MQYRLSSCAVGKGAVASGLVAPPHLPRFHKDDERESDEARLRQILREVGADEELAPELIRAATAGGDRRGLRGIPVISRGCPGAIPGTDPARAIMAKERRRRR